jgi:uncharacterized membrane protein
MTNITIQDLNDLSTNLATRANALPISKTGPAWASLESQVIAIRAIFQVSPVDSSVAMAALGALQSSIVALEQANGIASPATPQPAPAPAGSNPAPVPSPAGGQTPVPPTSPTPAPAPQPVPAGSNGRPDWLDHYHTTAVLPIAEATRENHNRLNNHETRLANIESGGVRSLFLPMIAAAVAFVILGVLFAVILGWPMAVWTITAAGLAVGVFFIAGVVTKFIPRRRRNRNQQPATPSN